MRYGRAIVGGNCLMYASDRTSRLEGRVALSELSVIPTD
jgi:hypothetical protein